MIRLIAFLYGVATYVFFLVTFTYSICFVVGILVPKTLDSGPVIATSEAIVINLALLSIFALQHSIMARPAFKRWWTRIVPPAVERTTYVLLASLALALVIWQWRPIPALVWQVTDPAWAAGLLALSLFGALIALVSTFLINHFELVGLSQVTAYLLGTQTPPSAFRTPGFYKWVRHPLYFGLIVCFWATPVMTQGHLLFALGSTAYILVGIMLEERDLVAQFGDQYRRYRREVSALLPFWRRI